MPEIGKRTALSLVQRATRGRQPRRFLLKMHEVTVAYFIFYEGYDVKDSKASDLLGGFF